MSTEDSRTPERLLVIGCTSFAGLDSIAWDDQIVPNIPDYDLIVVSVPHITKDFLATVKGQFFKDMRRALVRFLHSGGKMIVLVSPRLSVNRKSLYPEHVSNINWCPISYDAPNEAGKSIVEKNVMYPSYLRRMVEWPFLLTIPGSCLSDELTDFYGATHNTKYRIPLGGL
ncbi:MAG: hypothetical protein FD174_1211 [Geobacteraceae bacterium]|nr:MAG: hypothetical protein FD174_1211 [Geobacteraceae bacterium]